jgi:hypothetical protein
MVARWEVGILDGGLWGDGLSDSNIKYLSDKQRKNGSDSIKRAIKRAKRYIRNVDAENLDEPEDLVSGDMGQFLKNPEKYGDNE